MHRFKPSPSQKEKAERLCRMSGEALALQPGLEAPWPGLRQALALTEQEEFARVPSIFPVHRLPWELQRHILSYADPRGLLACACKAVRENFCVSWMLGAMHAWDAHRYTTLASAAEKERVEQALDVEDTYFLEHESDIYWLIGHDAIEQFQSGTKPDPRDFKSAIRALRSFATCMLCVPIGRELEPFDVEAGEGPHYPGSEEKLQWLWSDRFRNVLYPCASGGRLDGCGEGCADVLGNRTVSLLEYLGIVTVGSRTAERTANFCKRNEVSSISSCRLRDALVLHDDHWRDKPRVQHMHHRGLYDVLCNMYLRDVRFTGRAEGRYGARSCER
jgi:hypothetical protein